MAHLRGGVILEENQGYVIRRTILFDNKCGFVLGEDPKAPNPYVTWQFNEQDGHRDPDGTGHAEYLYRIRTA